MSWLCLCVKSHFFSIPFWNLLKGYLRYKTVFYHKIALDVSLMKFFIWRQNNVLFTRYLDFRHCYIMELHLCLFLLNPKYYHNGIWLNTSVLYDFHVSLNGEDWKLVPGPFMILLKWQYSEIWPFVIVDIYHFQLSLIHLFKKMKHWNLDIIGY